MSEILTPKTTLSANITGEIYFPVQLLAAALSMIIPQDYTTIHINEAISLVLVRAPLATMFIILCYY